MSFSLELRSLGSGNTYNLKTRLQMSVYEEQSTAAYEQNVDERSDEASTEFSPDIIIEKIKANLERLHAQNITLTQMMNKLIQEKSAGTNPTSTAGSRNRSFPSKSPLTDSTSRTLPLELRITAGYSPNTTPFCLRSIYRVFFYKIMFCVVLVFVFSKKLLF